jgi:hypothetical protein
MPKKDKDESLDMNKMGYKFINGRWVAEVSKRESFVLDYTMQKYKELYFIGGMESSLAWDKAREAADNAAKVKFSKKKVAK